MLNLDDEQANRRQSNQKYYKKTFIMRKLDLGLDSNLQNKIHEAFSDPDKYLETDKDMMIGKVTQFPKLERKRHTLKKFSTIM